VKLAIGIAAAVSVIIVGMSLVIAARSPQSGPSVMQYQELRDLTGFSDIVLAGDIELEITQGEDFLVQVAATADVLTGIHTLVEGTTLDIHPGNSGNGFFGLFAPDFHVRVTLPEMTSLTVHRGAEADGTNTFTGERLAVVSTGGSEVDLAVDVASISIELSGGSDVDLTGAARTATINVRGGSDFSGFGFAADDAAVEIRGGSECTLAVTNRLEGSVSGGSNLVYQGAPATVEVRATGGAEVSSI